MRALYGTPRSDSHRVNWLSRIPKVELFQFPLQMNCRSEVPLKVLDDLFCIEVRRELSGWVIAGMSIRHVSGQHALQSSAFHGPQAHWLAEQADLGVEANINQVRQASLLADCVDFGLGVRHPVVFADLKSRVHAVPAVITRAAFPSASAPPSVRNGRARDIDDFRDGTDLQRKYRLTLGQTDVIVDHVAGAEHHGHPQRSGCCECPVDSGYECINPHGGGLAPVMVPNIDCDHAYLGGVDLLPDGMQFSSDGVTCLEFQLNPLAGGWRRIGLAGNSRRNDKKSRAQGGSQTSEDLRAAHSWSLQGKVKNDECRNKGSSAQT